MSKERKFTRSEKAQAEGIIHKSALTDHHMRTNHVINWEGAKVLDHENYVRSRQVREAIWIRRNSKSVINRDQGAYQLSQVYNQLITAPSGGGGVDQRA